MLFTTMCLTCPTSHSQLLLNNGKLSFSSRSWVITGFIFPVSQYDRVDDVSAKQASAPPEAQFSCFVLKIKEPFMDHFPVTFLTTHLIPLYFHLVSLWFNSY